MMQHDQHRAHARASSCSPPSRGSPSRRSSRAIFMIWVERKFVAKIQLRVGPQYAGKFGGILQNFADLFKLLFKEIIIPDKADKAVFLAVPLALMFVAGALLALVPLGPTPTSPTRRSGRSSSSRSSASPRSSPCSPDGRATASTRSSGASGRSTRWWPTRSR